MVGTLAQTIALTAYGNDYLLNGHIHIDFNSSNTTFQFCNRVDFRELKKVLFSSKHKEKIVANNPTEWFAYLKANGCKHLALYYECSKEQSVEKDYKLSGFIGGGGTWYIEAMYNGYSRYWTSRWEVTNKNALDRKIWAVNYNMLSELKPTNNLRIDEQLVKDELKHTLNEITDFALKQNFQYWAEQFDKARTILDSALPEEHYYHKDLIPLDNYLLLEKQLLFSAGSAWVFGGMGSWNDLGCDNEEDNKTYDRLSSKLYSNINKAIISSINTSN